MGDLIYSYQNSTSMTVLEHGNVIEKSHVTMITNFVM